MANNNNTAVTHQDQKMFLKDIELWEKRLKEIMDNDFDKRCSVTNKGGRPYKNSPQELAEKGIKYFRTCIEAGRPVTISGLALVMGTSRRQMLNWQEGRPDGKGNYNQLFGIVISSLKNFVGYYYEVMGDRAKNPYFFIFVLSRLWREKS